MWQGSLPSPDRTHHIKDGKALYLGRFDEVLSFHAPGLAPVRQGSVWFHIRDDGKPAYEPRFDRAFGFYNGLAAVVERGVAYHILPTGEPAYTTMFAWCGNFQEGLCSVQDLEGHYFHIHSDGTPAYPDRYAYVGDFREGAAVVFSPNRMAWHIDVKGNPISDNRFLDLGPFHKGVAPARDSMGWFHIDRRGSPLYSARHKAVEPFYNGRARVEAQDGNIVIINERGETTAETLGPQRTELQHLSRLMVGYWSTQTIGAAVKLGVFDALPGSVEDVAKLIALPLDGTVRILRGLWELGLVKKDSGVWVPTPAGSLLRTNGGGMANAALHWAGGHYRVWEDLVEALRSGQPQFDGCKGRTFFEHLRSHPGETKQFHAAMVAYAEHDYAEIVPLLELPVGSTLIDAGGGHGALLRRVLERRSDLQGILLDLPEVVTDTQVSEEFRHRFRAVGGDLFAVWPCSGDTIVMSRVLHDWPDEQAIAILARARNALLPGGRVCLVELVLSPNSPDGGLLDLNMLLVCGGRERTLEEWRFLVASAGMAVVRVRPLLRYGALIELTPR